LKGTGLNGFVAPASPLINGPKGPVIADAGERCGSAPPTAVPTHCPPATATAKFFFQSAAIRIVALPCLHASLIQSRPFSHRHAASDC
jgi:hypothetical protein